MEEAIISHSPRFHPEDGIEPTATWEAPEYHHAPKTKDWYWGLGIITVTILILSFLLGDILFGIFTIIAAFTLAIFAHQPPRMVKVEMNRHGLTFGRTHYPYSELESYWVDVVENPAHPKILFKSKRTFMPYIAIPLGDMHPGDIAEYLFNFLPEVEHKEPLLMRLLEDFGM